MNQVLADKDRTLCNCAIIKDKRALLSAMVNKKANTVKVHLTEEEGRIIKQQAELKEEKQQLLITKEDVRWMQAKKENTCKDKENLKNGYVGLLDICGERLVQRNKLCCEIEGALIRREQACIKQEGKIKNQVKYLKMLYVVLQQEDDAMMNCKMLCRKQEDALSRREQACISKKERLMTK